MVPESVKVPVPDLSMAPVPLMSPEKVVSVLSAPVVSVVPLNRLTDPVPVMEPKVSLVVIVRVAPLATVTALVSFRDDPLLTVSVPADTVVVPELVLVPERVTVPLPCLVNVPVPLMSPEYSPSVLWLKITAALLVILQVRLSVVLDNVPAETVVPPL